MAEDNYATTAPLGARADFNARHATVGWLDWVAARLPAAGPGARVLDAGCGPGWLWRAGGADVAPGAALTLLDRSPAMVRAAEERLAHREPRPVGVVADVADPGLPAGSFDLIACTHVLYHADDPGAALNALAALLAPGGALVVTTIRRNDLPKVNALTRDAYGHDPVAPLHDRFAADVAAPLLAARFAAVERHDHADTYRIEDADALAAHVLSIPPGPGLGEADRARVADLAAERIAGAGGILVTGRRQTLFLCRRPHSAEARTSSSG
ncbi:class I SAM-dependent methyltransferase [Jannaschia sp. Os4]|uniref:class I SAM-dependent methyltransferase n=1 Tax=Jannaschia sp. Os4 TaxID=2807617 RepID=UPI001939292F|nr:class I SAM-dependent methyltransferase [Jannaschia sp. Os4]MBM2577425.1 class I SAM-dependent methyltransferase [Jannaschia sp. Os4]